MLVNRGKEYGFWSREMNIMPMHMNQRDRRINRTHKKGEENIYICRRSICKRGLWGTYNPRT